MARPIADVAAAIALGRRARQEDAVIANFAGGEDSGLAVLSDGMGGHDDGDLAARVIVSGILGAFSLSGRPCPSDQSSLRCRLLDAVRTANQSLRHAVDDGQGQEGMGGTVIAAVLENDRLSWISVGDSSLYLFRDGVLSRLNDNHSLGPQIDLLVDRGVIDAETARRHPQRGCLTSALVGAKINSIDCPDEPVLVGPGDILLLASDGLEVLGQARIARLLALRGDCPSQDIASALIEAVADANEPEQDNVSVIVIKPGLRSAEMPTDVTRAIPSSAVLSALRTGISCIRQSLIALLVGRSTP